MAEQQDRLQQVSLDTDAAALVGWARWMGDDAMTALSAPGVTEREVLQGERLAILGWGNWMGQEAMAELGA